MRKVLQGLRRLYGSGLQQKAGVRCLGGCGRQACGEACGAARTVEVETGVKIGSPKCDYGLWYMPHLMLRLRNVSDCKVCSTPVIVAGAYKNACCCYYEQRG